MLRFATLRKSELGEGYHPAHGFSHGLILAALVSGQDMRDPVGDALPNYRHSPEKISAASVL